MITKQRKCGENVRLYVGNFIVHFPKVKVLVKKTSP